MKYVVMLLILTGFVGMAHASQDEATHSTRMSFEEHYEIEILGLEDEYSTDEEYSFDFVISGYGYGCANYQVSYPDGNGLLIGTGAQSRCAAQTSMYEFEIKSFDRHGTLGNVAIKKPGAYAVTVTFEKPSKYFPTTVNKEFLVVDSLDNNFNELTPLKQFKSGVLIDGIQCRENLILIPKHDSSPACVKPETISKLIERGWTTQSLVQDIVMNTMSKKLGPECSQNTMDEIMSGKMVDEKCARFIDELFTKRQSEMMRQGYVFDQESKSWTKEGHPDMFMNIADYYQQNLKNLEPKPLSEINRSCMTLEQSKETAPFFKVPSHLPDGYSMKCSMSGTPSESYIIYHNKDVSDGWLGKLHELIDGGAIFIHQVDERNIVDKEKYATFGSPEQRMQDTYDDVMIQNPSLQPQLIRINEILAYAVDSCTDCGMQTADFADGTLIQKSTSTETKIKFIDEDGVTYMLKTTLPLDELILVAESFQ